MSLHGVRHALIFNGEGITIQDMVDIAVEAERAGFDSVWHTEDERELWVPLSAIALATSRIRVGAGVAIISRPPMFTEQAAANLDELSGGRHVLGLGAGPEFRSESWHGVDWSQPALRMREYVEAIREMWTAHSGREVSYSGRRIHVDAYVRGSVPLRERVPIFLGGSGPMMLRVAGELGDGLVFDVLTTPLLLETSIKAGVEVGLERRGRGWEDIERGCLILTAVHEDRSAAIDLARDQVGYYLQFPHLDALIDLHGLGDQAGPLREARERGDLAGMAAGVTDRMVESFSLVGTPSEVRERLGKWTRHIDMPLLYSPTRGLTREQVLENHLAMTAAFAR